jgi:hypothetical protein
MSTHFIPPQNDVEYLCILQQLGFQRRVQHVIRQKRQRRDLRPLQSVEHVIFAETGD